MKIHAMRLPSCDAWGVPTEKMPRCPHCREDELGMMRPGHALCYACGIHVIGLK